MIELLTKLSLEILSKHETFRSKFRLIQGGVTERPAHGWCRKVQVFAHPVVEIPKFFLHTYVSKRPKFFTLKTEGQAKWGLLKGTSSFQTLI